MLVSKFKTVLKFVLLILKEWLLIRYSESANLWFVDQQMWALFDLEQVDTLIKEIRIITDTKDTTLK